ncbi:MAG: hypothetical protein JWP04_2381 [Belnapia sp.]|jgi:hypothetical protein|nr:hypothetical protein [Belnapia sp.]
MPLVTLTNAELLAGEFYAGAGGQWYCNSGLGNRDNGDNHMHLMGTTSTPGYDPVNNRNPATVLAVERVELKLRCPGQPIQRVWLLRMVSGVFAMPINLQGLNRMEELIAAEMFAMLPAALR